MPLPNLKIFIIWNVPTYRQHNLFIYIWLFRRIIAHLFDRSQQKLFSPDRKVGFGCACCMGIGYTRCNALDCVPGDAAQPRRNTRLPWAGCPWLGWIVARAPHVPMKHVHMLGGCYCCIAPLGNVTLYIHPVSEHPRQTSTCIKSTQDPANDCLLKEIHNLCRWRDSNSRHMTPSVGKPTNYTTRPSDWQIIRLFSLESETSVRAVPSITAHIKFF